jgi:hypothetical protein
MPIESGLSLVTSKLPGPENRLDGFGFWSFLGEADRMVVKFHIISVAGEDKITAVRASF